MQEPRSAASLAREETGTEAEQGVVILADLRSLFPCLRFLDGDGNSETVGSRFCFLVPNPGAGRPDPGARRRREGKAGEAGATGVAERETARDDRTTCTLGGGHVTRIERIVSLHYWAGRTMSKQAI